jgi:hypothetical protein
MLKVLETKVFQGVCKLLHTPTKQPTWITVDDEQRPYIFEDESDLQLCWLSWWETTLSEDETFESWKDEQTDAPASLPQAA